jgi:hypothetical protein
MAKEAPNPEKCPAKKFLQMLQEMEENHEHNRQVLGSFGYPGIFNAVYGVRVQIGLSNDNKIV